MQNGNYFIPGFYTIRSQSCGKYLNIDVKDNRLILGNEDPDYSFATFKIIKTNDGFYQFISKKNDLSLCLDSDNLVFSSYQADKEESKFKLSIELSEKIQQNKQKLSYIQSFKNHKFINLTDELNLVMDWREKNFKIFYSKVKSDKSLLADNYFSIETYIGNKTLSLDSNGVFRPSDVFNKELFLFKSIVDKFKIILNEKALDIDEDQQLSHKESYETFLIESVRFDQNLICIKTTDQDANQYVRLDLTKNNFVVDTDIDNVNEYNMFRIKNQNNTIFE